MPKYTLHLQIPDAEELTHGNEVHEGGALIGLVTSVDPARSASGQPIAVMNMALDKNVEPLPKDSTFTVRLKGSIGLKYVDVAQGHSSATWPNGATVPLGHSGADTDLDQLFGMFTPRTRTGVSEATNGFSDALAGRGDDINNAIGAFVPLVTDLAPVAVNLASRQTDLAGSSTGSGASRARSRRWPPRRPTCTRTWTRPSRRWRASPTRTYRTGSRRPHQRSRR